MGQVVLIVFAGYWLVVQSVDAASGLVGQIVFAGLGNYYMKWISVLVVLGLK